MPIHDDDAFHWQSWAWALIPQLDEVLVVVRVHPLLPFQQHLPYNLSTSLPWYIAIPNPTHLTLLSRRFCCRCCIHFLGCLHIQKVKGLRRLEDIIQVEYRRSSSWWWWWWFLDLCLIIAFVQECKIACITWSLTPLTFKHQSSIQSRSHSWQIYNEWLFNTRCIMHRSTKGILYHPAKSRDQCWFPQSLHPQLRLQDHQVRMDTGQHFLSQNREWHQRDDWSWWNWRRWDWHLGWWILGNHVYHHHILVLLLVWPYVVLIAVHLQMMGNPLIHANVYYEDL